MPIGSGRVGGFGVKATPGIKGPHKGIGWRSPAFNQSTPSTPATALSPTFSVDWTTTSSLPSQVTLSRTSAATYWNSSGVLASASSGTARIEYNPATLVQQGLLLEEQRSNTLQSSMGVVQSGFYAAGGFSSTGTDATVLCIDGTTSSLKVLANTVNTAHEYFSNAAQTTTASVPYCFSVYAKAGTHNYVTIARQSNGPGMSCTFDLSNTANNTTTQTFNGTSTGTINSSGQQYVGNGWFRIWMVTTDSATTNQYWIISLAGAATGNNFGTGDGSSFWAPAGTESVNFCGGQWEQGTSPTSLIVTGAATSIRSADIATSTDATLLAAQGWVVEVGELQAATASTLLGINTAIGLGETAGNALTTAIGGTQTSGNTGTWTSQNRGGIAWDSTPRVSIDLDGGTVVTAANTPITPTALYFGNTNNGASGFLNGHLRMMAAYAAVSDTQLATISTVGAPFTISGAGVSATLAATEAQDTAAIAASVGDNAALAATEAADTAAIVATVGDNAALAATEAQDVALINATETDVAVLSATEAQDTAAIVVQVKDNAALAATEVQDVAAINASVGDNAALAATETKDVALINASGSDVAVLAATEAADVSAFVVTETDNAALAATESRDVAAFVVTGGDNAALAATEAADIAAVTVTVGATIAVLAATEKSDVSRFSVAVTGIVIPPDPRPSHGLRRIYPAAGVPGVYGADIFGSGDSGTTPDFSSGDFSGDFARTGTPMTAGSGASIYGAAGALNKPLRRTTGPQMRRTYKYPVQLIPGGIYDKDIYGQNIYQSDS